MMKVHYVYTIPYRIMSKYLFNGGTLPYNTKTGVKGLFYKAEQLRKDMREKKN